MHIFKIQDITLEVIDSNYDQKFLYLQLFENDNMCLVKNMVAHMRLLKEFMCMNLYDLLFKVGMPIYKF